MKTTFCRAITMISRKQTQKLREKTKRTKQKQKKQNGDQIPQTTIKSPTENRCQEEEEVRPLRTQDNDIRNPDNVRNRQKHVMLFEFKVGKKIWGEDYGGI